jgi:hypothetical protein
MNKFKPFWSEITDSKGNTKLAIVKRLLIECIEDMGYRKYNLKGGFTLVKIENDRIIDLAYEFNIRDEIKEYLLSNKHEEAWELFLNINNLSSYIIESIQTIIIEHEHGDKNTGYLFFLNGVLKIQSDKILLIKYSDYPSYLWKEQIIQRNFVELEDKKQSHFREFCIHLASMEEKTYYNLMSIIGYMLHSYKDPLITRAVILLDKDIDSENGLANGGTGKSLLAECIGKMTPTLFRKGKNANTNERFYFADLELFHKVVVFDDVSENFDFEALYSMITAGIPIERKYKNPLVIPFKDSPKILISSNYTVLSRLGNSEERRKIEFEVSGYFRDTKTPFQHFGHTFFIDWDEEEWQKFDNYMVSTLQYYLKFGVNQVTTENVAKNQLIRSTSKEFVNFMSLALNNPELFGGTKIDENRVRLDKSIFCDKFRQEINQIQGYTNIKIKQWIDIYAQFKKYQINHFKSNSKSLVEFSKNEEKAINIMEEETDIYAEEILKEFPALWHLQ